MGKVKKLISEPWCWVCALENLRGSKMKTRRKVVDLADTIIAKGITNKCGKGMSLNKKRRGIVRKRSGSFFIGVQILTHVKASSSWCFMNNLIKE